MNLKPRELTTAEFCTGLGVKILMGLAYGYLFLHFYHGDDTWKIHQQSIKETALLLSDPGQFFLNEYTPAEAIQKGGTFKEICILYLNDLEYALVIKTVALFNLISQGNYYINVVLFNLVVFWGHYWLFIFFKDLFPFARKRLFVVIFLFLPAVFWLSGIRADGLLFFFFSLFLLNTYRRKNILLTIIAFTGMFVLRPQFAILLLTAFIPYLLSLKLKIPPLRIFIASYIIAVILFFATGLQHMVVEKQQQFSKLTGTRFNMKGLEPGVLSFIEAFPKAVNHTFLRPYPWEANNILQLFYSLEIIFFWLIIITAIIKSHKAWKERLFRPVILMLLFFCVSAYVLTGYIVPFPGAIVRYKIIPELIILCIASTLITENINISILSKKRGLKG